MEAKNIQIGPPCSHTFCPLKRCVKLHPILSGLVLILMAGVVLLSIPGSLGHAADVENQWKPAKDKDGIQVYTRPVKGFDFREYRGVTLIKTSVSSLVALVDDITVCSSWIPTCKEGRLLKRLNARETYTYTMNHAPWPVKDRDAIVHNRVSQDPKTKAVTIAMTGKPGYIPREHHFIRVEYLKGFWKFIPKSDGYVQVIYQVLNNPGGGLPAWLVNAAVVSQPFDTLFNMKKKVMEEKYQNAEYNFIKKVK